MSRSRSKQRKVKDGDDMKPITRHGREVKMLSVEVDAHLLDTFNAYIVPKRELSGM